MQQFKSNKLRLFLLLLFLSAFISRPCFADEQWCLKYGWNCAVWNSDTPVKPVPMTAGFMLDYCRQTEHCRDIEKCDFAYTVPLFFHLTEAIWNPKPDGYLYTGSINSGNYATLIKSPANNFKLLTIYFFSFDNANLVTDIAAIRFDNISPYGYYFSIAWYGVNGIVPQSIGQAKFWQEEICH